MQFTKVLKLEKLDKIEEEFYTIIFAKDEDESYREMLRTIMFLDKKYSEKIYVVREKLIQDNGDFEDINVFPSIFMFQKGNEYPDYFFNGLIDKDKFEENAKQLKL